MKGSQIGFGRGDEKADETTEFLKLSQTKDFIEYGFEPEFIGRLPVRVACSPLSADDLEKVLLQSEGSILAQYRTDFAAMTLILKRHRMLYQKLPNKPIMKKRVLEG